MGKLDEDTLEARAPSHRVKLTRTMTEAFCWTCRTLPLAESRFLHTLTLNEKFNIQAKEHVDVQNNKKINK